MRFAALYPITETDLENPRRCEAATRLAYYRLRRIARAHGYPQLMAPAVRVARQAAVKIDGVDVALFPPATDGKDCAIYVQADATKATR